MKPGPRPASDVPALRIVYRDVPTEKFVIPPREASSCKWCEFCTGHVSCQAPLMTGGINLVLHKLPDERLELIGNGDCPGYRPSLFTRLLRLVGLRKPQMK